MFSWALWSSCFSQLSSWGSKPVLPCFVVLLIFSWPQGLYNISPRRDHHSMFADWNAMAHTSLSAFSATTKDFEKEKGKSVLSRGVCWIQEWRESKPQKQAVYDLWWKTEKTLYLFVGCYCSKRKIHKRKALLLLPSQKTEWNLSVSGDLVFWLSRSTAWLWHQPTGSQIHVKPFY